MSIIDGKGKSDRLNWSTLRYLAISPRMLAWRVEYPQPETDAPRLGRAIHCAILEPGEFAARWLTPNVCGAPLKSGGACENPGALLHQGHWYCRVKSHAPIASAADTDPLPEGVEMIGGEDRALALTVAESVRAHPAAARLLSTGEAERRIEWTDATTGIQCRGRVDWIDSGRGLLVDLKSTRRETLREITRDAADHLYHGQIAWYYDGAVAAGVLPADAPRPYLLAVSTAEPYDVAPMRLSMATLESGRILYRDLIRRYAQCMAAGWWPGIAPDVIELDLPSWAAGMNGPETEETW